MARIRTLKPEFPQSESMGRVSRDARLLFIQMWTIADDSGRLRGNSRMLASLLFPYDDDAPALMDGWIAELEAEGCIVRYKAEGQTYIEICKWLNHQKIDKPSPSKIPPSDESSRILANPRESSPLDQGSRIKEGIKEGNGEDHISCASDKSKAAPYPPGFMAFWEAWPKSDRKQGKAECLKRWQKVGLEQRAGEIVAKVKAWSRSDQWTREGGKYLPMPATWLQGRYDDDMPPDPQDLARQLMAEKWGIKSPDVIDMVTQ